jgi:hypothetical protein
LLFFSIATPHHNYNCYCGDKFYIHKSIVLFYLLISNSQANFYNLLTHDVEIVMPATNVRQLTFDYM